MAELELKECYPDMDASVLLDIYRYHKEDINQTKKILNELIEESRIPHFEMYQKRGTISEETREKFIREEREAALSQQILKLFSSLKTGNHSMNLRGEELLVFKRGDYPFNPEIIPNGMWCFTGLYDTPRRCSLIRPNSSKTLMLSVLQVLDGNFSFQRRSIGQYKNPQDVKITPVGRYLIVSPPTEESFVVDPINLETIGQAIVPFNNSEEFKNHSSPCIFGNKLIYATTKEDSVNNKKMLYLCIVDPLEQSSKFLRLVQVDEFSSNFRLNLNGDDDDWEIVSPVSSDPSTQNEFKNSVFVPGDAQLVCHTIGNYILVLVSFPFEEDIIIFVAQTSDSNQPKLDTIEVKRFDGLGCGPVRHSLVSRGNEKDENEILVHILRDKYFGKNICVKAGDQLRGASGNVVVSVADGLPSSDQRNEKEAHDNIKCLQFNPKPGVLLNSTLSCSGPRGTVSGVPISGTKDDVCWISRGSWPELDTVENAKKWGLTIHEQPPRQLGCLYVTSTRDSKEVTEIVWESDVPAWIQSVSIATSPDASKRDFIFASCVRVDESSDEAVHEFMLFDGAEITKRNGMTGHLQKEGPAFLFRAAMNEASGLAIGCSSDIAHWIPFKI